MAAKKLVGACKPADTVVSPAMHPLPPSALRLTVEARHELQLLLFMCTGIT